MSARRAVLGHVGEGVDLTTRQLCRCGESATELPRTDFLGVEDIGIHFHVVGGGCQ